MVGTWPELHIDKEPGIDLDPGGHYQFAVIRPLALTLNGQQVLLGSTEEKALSAVVTSTDGDRVTVVPHLNNTVRSDYLPPDPDAQSGLPEGKVRVRYRRLPDDLGATASTESGDLPR